MYLNIIKAIYDKLTANIILNGEKAETISPKVRNATRMPTFPTHTQHRLGIHRQNNKAGRRIKMNTNRKRSSQLYLCTDDMILYLKDSKYLQINLTKDVNDLYKGPANH
jgi:hypothetical protein